MAIVIRGYVDFCQIGDGAGTALLGQEQSNQPGFAAAQGVGAIPSAQTLRLQIQESVPGGDSPSLANFLTALNALAADMAGTPAAGGSPMLSITPNPYNGSSATVLSIIQGWSTGNP